MPLTQIHVTVHSSDFTNQLAFFFYIYIFGKKLSRAYGIVYITCRIEIKFYLLTYLLMCKNDRKINHTTEHLFGWIWKKTGTLRAKVSTSPPRRRHLTYTHASVFITYTKIITRIYFSSRGKGTSIKSVGNKLGGATLPS